MTAGLVDGDGLDAALARDGFVLDNGDLSAVRPPDEPADRLAAHVVGLLGADSDLAVARNHYEQASRAFDRGDWEAANAQFRSALDAAYDALARSHGCPASRTGGKARQWLQSQGAQGAAGPTGAFSDRLYVVLAQERTTIRNAEAWAGLGWIQDDAGCGLFVEHHGGSRAEVERDIADSLAALSANRRRSFGSPRARIVGLTCDQAPVCAVVAAL
jgi:hypothetical protein